MWAWRCWQLGLLFCISVDGFSALWQALIGLTESVIYLPLSEGTFPLWQVSLSLVYTIYFFTFVTFFRSCYISICRVFWTSPVSIIEFFTTALHGNHVSIMHSILKQGRAFPSWQVSLLLVYIIYSSTFSSSAKTYFICICRTS